MELLHTFHIRAWHSPSAIARVCLVLSRRRLRAEEFHVAVADDPGFDDIEVRVRTGDSTAERLRHQFARVVEVVAVRHTGPAARRALCGRGLSPRRKGGSPRRFPLRRPAIWGGKIKMPQNVVIAPKSKSACPETAIRRSRRATSQQRGASFVIGSSSLPFIRKSQSDRRSRRAWAPCRFQDRRAP